MSLFGPLGFKEEESNANLFGQLYPYYTDFSIYVLNQKVTTAAVVTFRKVERLEAQKVRRAR